MITRLVGHIRHHPYRLILTLGVFVLLSWGSAGIAIIHTFRVEHQARVENCRAIDELNRELRLAWADAGYFVISDRFEDTRNCEELP
jgi:hypothetical protein